MPSRFSRFSKNMKGGMLDKGDLKYAKNLIDKRDAKIAKKKAELAKVQKFLKQIKAMGLDTFPKLKSMTAAQNKAKSVKRQQGKIDDLEKDIKELKNADLLSVKGANLVKGGKRS